MVNERLVKIDAQFKVITEAIDEALKAKKDSLIKMYQKDPRISGNVALMMENFNGLDLEEIFRFGIVEGTLNTPKTDARKIDHCGPFSTNSMNVSYLDDRRSIKYLGGVQGFCFLNHRTIDKNSLLKWSIQVPKFKYTIGIVTLTRLYSQGMKL